MSLKELLQAYATIFPAELPDKSMIATIVLVTRYRRPLWVWVGAVFAFALHMIVATAAGSMLGLLPEVPVQLAVAALFLVGAVVLFRAARAEAEDPEALDEVPTATVWATAVGSFSVIALAEWGDLTQLATASLAVKADSPVSVGLGAWLALASIAAIAATFGRQLVERVALAKVNYIGAAVFLALAIWTLVELAR